MGIIFGKSDKRIRLEPIIRRPRAIKKPSKNLQPPINYYYAANCTNNDQIIFFDYNLNKIKEFRVKGGFFNIEAELIQISDNILATCTRTGLIFIDLKENELLTSIQTPTGFDQRPICLCLLEDNRLALGMAGGLILIHNIEKEVIGEIHADKDIYCLKWIKETKTLWAGGVGCISLWTITNPENIYMKTNNLYLNTISVFGRTQKKMFAAGWDEILYELDLYGNLVNGQMKDNSFITQLVINSIDIGVTGMGDGSVSVWNLTMRVKLHSFRPSNTYLSSFSLLQISDYMFLVAGADRYVRLIDIYLGAVIKELQIGSRINGIAKIAY